MSLLLDLKSKTYLIIIVALLTLLLTSVITNYFLFRSNESLTQELNNTKIKLDVEKQNKETDDLKCKEDKKALEIKIKVKERQDLISRKFKKYSKKENIKESKTSENIGYKFQL